MLALGLSRPTKPVSGVVFFPEIRHIGFIAFARRYTNASILLTSARRSDHGELGPLKSGSVDRSVSLSGSLLFRDFGVHVS